MLRRVSRRLLVHSTSIHNTSTRRIIIHILDCSNFNRRLSIYSSLLVQCQPFFIQLRSFSQVLSNRPVVPPDEYEELKNFLSDPMTSGPSMERAKEIVTDWMQLYVDPSMPGQDASVMVMVAKAMENPQFVIQVYKCLRDAGVSPSPITLEYSAAACAQLGEWNTVLEIIDFMHQEEEIMPPSLSIYENAIRSCHAAKIWMKAKRLLEEMRTYKLRASTELYMMSIRLCIDCKELTATRVLFKALLHAYDEELDEMEKQEIVTDLITAALDAQSLPQTLFFREELLTRNYSVSKILYTRVIHLCAVERKWHMARVLLQQYVDINARPPQAALSNRYTDDIERLFKEMEIQDFEISLAVYNAALRNFGQLSLLDDAVAIYSKMRARNVIPDATSFAALICACGTHVEQSKIFFTELQHHQCKPTLNVVHGYLLVPSRAKQWEEVINRYVSIQECGLLEKLPLESDVRIQSLIAIAYGRLYRSEEMLRVFTSMKVQGLEPNLHVYGEAMFSYIRQTKWRHALMLFDHIFQHQTLQMKEKRMLENFPMLWDAAVLACVHGKDTQRAANLCNMIINQRVPISMVTGERLAAMLTSFPMETLWNSFKMIPSLHRTKNNGRLNPRVQNAILKRVVNESDTMLAEKIVAEGWQEIRIIPNSMTFALMLRLYSHLEDQINFNKWWSRMEQANVKPTIYIFRSLMRQLNVLSVKCENEAYLESFASFLQHKSIRYQSEKAIKFENARKYAAHLGRIALDVMEQCEIDPDALCLQNYLLLSQDSHHVARVLDSVEDAISVFQRDSNDDNQDYGLLSPRLLHTLFTTLTNFPDGRRVQNLLVQIVRDLPSDISEDALAAFCAANDGIHALQLLRELLNANCALSDEHILYFLTNSYTCKTSTLETETSRPRSGDHVIVDMAMLLCESKNVMMEASSLTFLIQQVVELSKWQERDVYEKSTQEEIDSMNKLLVRAFLEFSVSQVQDFLVNVVNPDDLVYFDSIFDELQAN
ncbi:putative tetratricopeptide-like helical domain superfamily [Plasmopara halstedii]